MRALVLVALAFLLAACEREQRTLVQPPKTAETVKTVRMNDLVSGERTSVGNAYERNAQGLADGKRLFMKTSDSNALRLVDSKPAGETLILTYQPAPKED